MWTSQSYPVDRQTEKFTFAGRRGILSFGEVIDLWCESADFREFFIGLVGGSPFEAFFWETPPVTVETLDRPFEFVLVEAAALSRLQPDPSPFQTHFRAQPSADVMTFPNLGGDAVLIVPAPIADLACYTHLARFLRAAPPAQVSAFWRRTGLALRERISSEPTWLSTAGMGVSWLHLRMDSRPKYYRHQPYRIYPYYHAAGKNAG